MAGWNKPPTSFIKVVETNLAATRNQVAMEALQLVVLASPVDTGAYRGSHQVSVDGPDYSIPERLDTSGGDTISSGLSVVGKATAPYQTVTVQTNLPYAEKLENGHSKQAPTGVYSPAYEYLRARYGK